ncbi:glycogen debranching enzyme, putative [Faunimonas pinastri]|uniref:Glycogen debranching enzyme, putative n=1 Tax=Faunimonas pinastri TaxID=1855383 RepID=A0A1H9A6L4_9HYPH|nr:amylo-alpha-1,6-glucosidase [Faunimonas pinastri]SEP71618.1 glycogen debranching enzyme, putative [Faunimonas pinastri]
MTDLSRTIELDRSEESEGKEFLVANGLGGFSSASVTGELTRRYHGVLVAALSSPAGRAVMLSRLDETFIAADGTSVPFQQALTEFRLELGLPVWTCKIGDTLIEKRLVMRHLQNTVDVLYRRLSGKPVHVVLRPWVGFRGLEDAVDRGGDDTYSLLIQDRHHEIRAGDAYPPLRIVVESEQATLEVKGGERIDVDYPVESERGYEGRGNLWSPGSFRARIDGGEGVLFIASVEPWHAIEALSSEDALVYEQQRRERLVNTARPSLGQGCAAELVLAADSFIIHPEARVADAARARAAGDEARTVIAGYHWFTDWGRDTMISLEGLTLATRRGTEAGWILRTFAHYIRDGLIPNMFPEGQSEGLYHTADATLWFFHAVGRYVRATGDTHTLQAILPKLRDIVRHHVEGTRFGIGVDSGDGLLRQGMEGYQLTWMDAKVDGWVVTPRRGKAVEINALWYNALRLMQGWLETEGDLEGAAEMEKRADQARASFNRRFWSDELGHLLDIVDGETGDDPACRPNQLFAVSLDNPVLDESRWAAVVETARSRLLTPVGLRSLAPGEPDYKPRYFGDLRTRDAAYHQGTVWGWLIGPYIDSFLKVDPGATAEGKRLLEGFYPHLSDAGVGSISEVFDAEAPFTPRGCISQAWSVAEWLRCWVKVSEDIAMG